MPQYMENKAQTSLICENPSYRKHIIDSACKEHNIPLFKEFVHKFYSYLPVDYMLPDRTNFFIDIAQTSFDFVISSSGTTKIQLTKRKQDHQGTILQIVTSDKPFIIDSIKSLLSRHNIGVELFLHPVMDIGRDSRGDVESIGSQAGRSESIVFAILHGVNSSNISEITERLEQILDKIDLVVKSQGEIKQQLEEIVKKALKNKDNINFLNWVLAENFTFLGALKYTKQGGIFNTYGDIGLYHQDQASMEEVFEKVFSMDEESMLLGKMNQISEVSTGKFVDYIVVRSADTLTLVFGFYCVGLNTQSVKSIPILGAKLEYVLARSGFRVDGYNYKKLLSIVESLPKDALLQIADEDLYCICLHILSAMTAGTLKLFIQVDGSGEFLNVLVFMPIERLTPETHFSITKYLAAKFNTKIITDEITAMSSSFCYLYVTLESKDLLPEFSLMEIEQDLEHISARWHLALSRTLVERNIDVRGNIEQMFPKEYQYIFSPLEAAEDYTFLVPITQDNPVAFNLQKKDTGESIIKVYSASKIILSEILPLIENLGFKALTQKTFDIYMGTTSLWICEFTLSASYGTPDNFKNTKYHVEEALKLMMRGRLEVDSICKLIVIEGLNWRQISLLKALVSYMVQTGISYGIEAIQSALVKHHQFASLLISLFEAKFDPSKHSTSSIESISNELGSFLNKVTNNVEDKILRSIFGIVEAITRSNYYQNSNGGAKEYISFKMDSAKVAWLPKPVPFAEIFVHSHDFEGVHLRGGPVARGGLRWSDRKEDYRTEALGLMKAQMTKNSVIVPVGSKGAFFIKISPDGMERADYMSRVVECYKNFLRGLLDITDNIVNGKISPPEECIIYDQVDPYLVVAADKGTATFSDYANAVSKEYRFWLGDAFASGGSAGYDHKKMAITARGAWISVRRHFSEMGIDVQKDNITVVGIGDMSGDVFGNGMLLSKAIKLVAAFNHKHIFIDPHPIPDVSFNERLRLFNLPGSAWSDYDSKLISKGGGVFERNAKFIHLSEEARKLLGIDEDQVTPDFLINKILIAAVDLIWNGGIGTYVKASDESHLEVGDKTNDNLRCNGRDIRAKVIGEGGNLGCSQRGRIEYAQAGGKVNTDFIDNSAGVDCSDHEVNIKIAFEAAIKDGALTLEERDKLLEKMTDEVAQLVLADNENQTQALTLTQKSVAYNTGMFSHLMSYLETEGALDRKVEFLPSDVEINKRAVNKESLTRPELAIIMSYSKMALYQNLLNSKVSDDEYAEKFLVEYFPATMRERMEKYIVTHQLRKEIILTAITNKVVNRLGGAIINQIKVDTGAQLCDIVRAYMVANHIFNVDALWSETTKLENQIALEVQVDMFSELIKLLRRGISWFVRNLEQPLNIAEAIDIYGDSVEKMYGVIGGFLLGQAKEKLQAKTKEYIDHQVPEELAYKIAALDSGISALDIMTLSIATESNMDEVATLYFKIADLFSLDWLRKTAEKNITDSYWNRLSVQALKDDIYDKQRRMLQQILQEGRADKILGIDLDSWMQKYEKHISIFQSLLSELKLQENIDLNMIILANKQFEILLRKL